MSLPYQVLIHVIPAKPAEPSHQKRAFLNSWPVAVVSMSADSIALNRFTGTEIHAPLRNDSSFQIDIQNISEPLAAWFASVFGGGSGTWCHSWPWQTHIVGDHFPWMQRVARMTCSEKKTGPWRPACQPHATRHGRPFSVGKRNPRTQETVGPKVDNDPLSHQLMNKCPWHVLSSNVQRTPFDRWLGFQPKLIYDDISFNNKFEYVSVSITFCCIENRNCALPFPVMWHCKHDGND